VTLTIGDDIAVASTPRPATAAVLRGDAVLLVDALSVRRPLPDDAPPEWHALVASLATIFDQ
jgi:hypothetical protein